jgi:hypothetical protein
MPVAMLVSFSREIFGPKELMNTALHAETLCHSISLNMLDRVELFITDLLTLNCTHIIDADFKHLNFKDQFSSGSLIW